LITHPEKLLFPEDGITKGDLAAYYERVAPFMLPHLRGRPLTMERYPAGIAKSGFIQKDVSKGFPAWLERVELPKKQGTVWYPIIGEERALAWVANQNCITLHVWPSRLPQLMNPDLCVFDLDPASEDPTTLRRAALAVRDLLAELGLVSWLKTSGSKGFHIVVPLDRSAGFEQVFHFAHGVGRVLVQRDSEHLTQEFSKADRGGRILVDTGRNGHGATFAAVYSVRPKPGAPVSAPCTWDELERGDVAPQSFTLPNLPQRLARVGDLWSDLYASGTPLDEAIQRLQKLLTPADWNEAHAATRRRPRSRRKATPE
jgi:bifunctional non-homologous end joining protein LigD